MDIKNLNVKDKLKLLFLLKQVILEKTAEELEGILISILSEEGKNKVRKELEEEFKEYEITDKPGF